MAQSTLRPTLRTTPLPLLFHPLPEINGVDLGNLTDSWLEACVAVGVSLEKTPPADYQPFHLTHSSEAPEHSNLAARGVYPSYDRSPTPTELATPPASPLHDAYTLHPLCESILPEEVPHPFPALLTVQVASGDTCSRCTHNNTHINGARVPQASKVSPHPTDTLGSQKGNSFLHSLGSTEAAELARKYPNPRQALRLITSQPCSPPVSDIAGARPNPPSHTLVLNLFAMDRERNENGAKRVFVNEYLEAVYSLMDREMVGILRAIGTFQFTQLHTPNLSELTSAIRRIQSVLQIFTESIREVLQTVNSDAWGVVSEHWKRKWWNNIGALALSLQIIHKRTCSPPPTSQSLKCNKRFVRHLATRIEDELDKIEDLTSTIRRLIMLVQAQYLSRELKQIKMRIRNNSKL